MAEITIEAWQKQVDDWIKSIGVRYFSPMSNMIQLVEEVGEVARIINRTAGDQSFKKSDPAQEDPMRYLGDEIADCIFALTCLANQHGIDLSAALERNSDKRNGRDKTRHINNPKLTGTTH